VCALTLVGGHDALVDDGIRWLLADQNDDGGFGDADGCPSNISTTALTWATLSMHASGASGAERARGWIEQRIGTLTASSLAASISDLYGEDRTFAVPILTHCALAGRFGWDAIPTLPFELAALPHASFKWVGLPVVSYALPALIAIGQVQHFHHPSPHWLRRRIRSSAVERTLAVLDAIQPTSGGFLEATPLTSFVTMSLASIGRCEHPVTQRGVRFLRKSVRADGSWPIDTNLATWVTTLSVKALGAHAFSAAERHGLKRWLLDQQYRRVHPFTRSAPGGWAWTDLPGGVPDSDDTAGVLLALAILGDSGDVDDARETRQAAAAGVRWLVDLQNTDGGIPTFCRGWGKLPFDQSSPDLTAHALRAWHVWRHLDPRVDNAMDRAVAYLERSQRSDGAWIPLWFGNPWSPGQTNPVYGTARVLECGDLLPSDTRRRGEAFLSSIQKSDGSFGTIEETALAVAVLGDSRGARWLKTKTDLTPAPIGLYFARLWYSEKLYPLIFSVAAFP